MGNSHGLGTRSWWPPDQAAADEFMAYSTEADLERTREQYQRVVGAAASTVLGAGMGATIFKHLQHRISNRIPSSYIRLGDADGNVLFSLLGKYPLLAQYCSAKISKIYFGNDSLMWREREIFGAIVLDAVRSADVIGAPEWGSIERSFLTPPEDLDVRGMCGMRGVYNYLAEAFPIAEIADAIWSSTWYSRSLLPHYIELLRGLPYVGFVSCYDELGLTLQERAGIREIETFAVPMQASIAYQTKRAPHMGKDIGHYPLAYQAILERLRPPFQGALYLVAAGILSKGYCACIKTRGGIAIDVGSIADVWMNTRSRPDMGKDILKWSLRPEDQA